MAEQNTSLSSRIARLAVEKDRGDGGCPENRGSAAHTQVPPGVFTPDWEDA